MFRIERKRTRLHFILYRVVIGTTDVTHGHNNIKNLQYRKRFSASSLYIFSYYYHSFQCIFIGDDDSKM